MTKNHYVSALAILLMLNGCNNSSTSENGSGTPVDSVLLSKEYSPGGGSSSADTAQSNNRPEFEKNGLRLYPVTTSPKFPESKLALNKPAENDKLAPGAITFDYAVTGFELTKQTEDAEHKDCANSKEGQHIHNIVDNEPYTAHYNTTFTKDIKAGNHVVLSFLSRSYHESLKHKDAYVLRQIQVGNTKEKPVDLSGPTMFYSRPKGEYKGEDTRRVLLDFYLVNTDLSPEGNRVRAVINGTDFMITNWQPYLIEGMPMGENTIRLELLDKDGNAIPGPYNAVERKITLSEE